MTQLIHDQHHRQRLDRIHTDANNGLPYIAHDHVARIECNRIRQTNDLGRKQGLGDDDGIAGIDLDLVKDGEGWKVSGFKVEARPIYERTADKKIVSRTDAVPAVLASVKDDHEATLDYMREPVGATSAT